MQWGYRCLQRAQTSSLRTHWVQNQCFVLALPQPWLCPGTSDSRHTLLGSPSGWGASPSGLLLSSVGVANSGLLPEGAWAVGPCIVVCGKV